MKIAGITIDKLDKVALLTTAKENGYSNSLMVSFIENGKLIGQTVFRNNDNFIEGYTNLCNRFKGYTWKTTLKNSYAKFIETHYSSYNGLSSKFDKDSVIQEID